DHSLALAISDQERLVFISVAYYLGAELAFAVGTLSDRIFAPFWPPNIVLMCTLISVPYRRWWLYVLAVLLPHIAAELRVGMDWSQLLVAFATNCLFAMLSAFGLRYFIAGPPWLGSFNNAVSYVLIAGVISPGISALLGAFVRISRDGKLAEYWVYWEQWYIANALASLTLGAAVLCWLDRNFFRPQLGTGWRKGEALLLASGLVIACVVSFNAGASAPRNLLPALVYLPLPLILWATVRFLTWGACASTLV